MSTVRSAPAGEVPPGCPRVPGVEVSVDDAVGRHPHRPGAHHGDGNPQELPQARQPPRGQEHAGVGEGQGEGRLVESDGVQKQRDLPGQGPGGPEALQGLCRVHIPYWSHFSSTSRLISSLITTSGGHSLVLPSMGPLAVASMPILLPYLGTGVAWSRSSMGPSAKTTSRAGSMLLADPPGDLRRVLHVDEVVHDDDRLGQHQQAEPPEGVHDLPGVAGVLLLDGDDHQVVEHPLGGHVDVNHLWQGHPQRGQEEPSSGDPHEVVLRWGPANHGGGVNGVPPVRDGGHVEHGVLLGRRVVPRVVPEGSLHAELAGDHVPLQDELRVGGRLQVDGTALDHLHGLVADKSRDGDLVQRRRDGEDSGPYGGGVSPQGDSHLQPVHLGLLPCPVVVSADLVGLPVHPGGLGVVDLHPVDADVPDARFGIAGDHQRQRDVASGVQGPALQRREDAQVGVLSGEDDLLAWGVPHHLGLGAGQADQVPESPHLVQHPGSAVS